MQNMFQKYLVAVAGLSSIGDGKSSTDFSMQASNGLVMVAQCKIGLEEKAQPQGLNYYHEIWSHSFPNKLGQSFAPTFILELMGAGLRIGGAVWTHKVQYEPLTDVTNLLPLLGQESAMLGLACQMQALRERMSDLVAEHNHASPELASGSNRLSLFAKGIPPQLHRFHEIQALPYPMLYRCRESSSDVQMVAKFAIRYGMDVHRAWAAGAWPPDCCILRSLTRLTPCSWSSWSGCLRLTAPWISYLVMSCSRQPQPFSTLCNLHMAFL